MALKEEFLKQGNWLFRYRGTLPLVFIVAGLAVYLFQLDTGQISLIYNEPYWYLCLAIGLFGLFIRCMTIGQAHDHTSGRNTESGQVAHNLNTTGWYSMVRHPLYLGNYFMWLAVCMLTGHLWFCLAFTLLYWLYYERIMWAEESFLRGKFGDQYVEWSNGRAAFIPNLGKFKAAKVKFKWKQVINRERNGLAALFLLFFVFHLIRLYFLKNEFQFQWDFWSIGMLFVLLFFAIVKGLKKFTKVFDRKK